MLSCGDSHDERWKLWRAGPAGPVPSCLLSPLLPVESNYTHSCDFHLWYFSLFAESKWGKWGKWWVITSLVFSGRGERVVGWGGWLVSPLLDYQLFINKYSDLELRQATRRFEEETLLQLWDLQDMWHIYDSKEKRKYVHVKYMYWLSQYLSIILHYYYLNISDQLK